jgi:hypothetical protein
MEPFLMEFLRLSRMQHSERTQAGGKKSVLWFSFVVKILISPRFLNVFL